MKILILNWRDIHHPLAGGAEQSLFEHAKYWKKKKAQVTWFASHFPKAKKREVIDGITVIRKGSHFTVHFWAFFYFLTKRFGEFDLVIDSFHFLPFFTPLYIPSKKIIGLINEIAGKVWFENLIAPLAFIGYLMEPYFFLLYKKILFITGSESTKVELIHTGIVEKNITVIHHGFHNVPVDKKIVKEKNPTLVFLGRVSKDKGIQDCIEVYLVLKKKIKNLAFWIIGREEKIGIIKKLRERYHLQGNQSGMTYFGFVSQEKKFSLLKKSWMLIHPSKKEGWGLNVIEAASQGTPTLGYDVEGLRDSVLNGKTGILVAPNHTEQLSSSVLSLITDKKKYTHLSKNAVQWSKQFNWRKSTRESWELLSACYSRNNEKE